MQFTEKYSNSNNNCYSFIIISLGRWWQPEARVAESVVGSSDRRGADFELGDAEPALRADGGRGGEGLGEGGRRDEEATGPDAGQGRKEGGTEAIKAIFSPSNSIILIHSPFISSKQEMYPVFGCSFLSRVG